jgi:hypothetical protein
MTTANTTKLKNCSNQRDSHTKTSGQEKKIKDKIRSRKYDKEIVVQRISEGCQPKEIKQRETANETQDF